MWSQASHSVEAPWLLCKITQGDALGTAWCICSRSAAAGRRTAARHGRCALPQHAPAAPWLLAMPLSQQSHSLSNMILL